MRKLILVLITVGLLAGGGAGCAQKKERPGGATRSAYVGVILPDNKTTSRWEKADRRFLEDGFKAAGIKYTIQNAQGDKVAFERIADEMINDGVRVLMIVSVDAAVSRTVLLKAKAKGIATIDYDRLTLGGSAQYYVSFDNIKVGELQGQGLVKCLAAKGIHRPVVAELNGSPTDHNATLFKRGYDSVLNPKFDKGEFVKGPDQSVPGWDRAQAATMFEQMLTGTPNIGGVLAANDGLGNSVIGVLRKQKLNGKVPVTGQDATVQGLQNILAGDQCMTVYKAVRREATAAADLAVALASAAGNAADIRLPNLDGVVHDPTSNRDVPSLLLTPKAIDKSSVKDVVADGFVSVAELCTPEFAVRCAEAGIG